MQPYHPGGTSQNLYPATPGSPAYEKESHMLSDAGARRARQAGDETLREYEEKRDKISKVLDSSAYLVADLRNFNSHQYNLKYPLFHGDAQVPHRPRASRRTMTCVDEPAQETQVEITQKPTRMAPVRSLSVLPSGSTQPEASSSSSSSSSSSMSSISGSVDEFTVFRLDLNMGVIRHAKNLVSHLEDKSVSVLLDNRFGASLDHLAALKKRVEDTHSRVLVTGDLNAGKSTLINALLRRNEVMPTDEQPLTTRFVEVVNASENEDREEIHIVDQESKYDPADKSTYRVEAIDKLEELATEATGESDTPSVRVFLKNASTDLANPSILHNDAVDISLIDAPGLNRDSIKTTANFARQEEIDVVVFVVSAANHFTLSAKEFIWQAGHEKAHLFIVVNRFDQIKDKARCRRAVLEQIKQLSPKTYEDAADLVHFVDSAKVAFGFSDDQEDAASEALDEAFCHLEHSLRSFVLVNRAKSKLGPAQNYVNHLLSDVDLMAQVNTIYAKQQHEAAKREIDEVKPELERMKKSKEGLEESLVAEEGKYVQEAVQRTTQLINAAIERIGRGELAQQMATLSLPAYPGLLGAWDYIREVRQAMLQSLDFVVAQAEDEARRFASNGVAAVTDLGHKCLPADVERSARQFNPAAMFSARRVVARRRSSGMVNMPAVGLGLAKQSALANPAVSDLFDLHHHLFLARKALPATTTQSSSSSSPSMALVPWSGELSGVGLASLAVGALSFSGKAMSVNSLIDGIIRVSDFTSSPVTQRWIGPVLSAAAIAAVAYLVYDLPNSIPRNVGRSIQAALAASSGYTAVSGGGEVPDGEQTPFAQMHAERVKLEMSKVLRIVAWDLRERFTGAMNGRASVVKENEERMRRAKEAELWFAQAGVKSGEIRAMLEEIKL